MTLDEFIEDEYALMLASLPPLVPVRRKGRITYFRVVKDDFALWESELVSA